MKNLQTILSRLALIAPVGLLLAACSLASEPVPAGPIQTGPQPGEVVPTVAAAGPVSLPSAASGAQIYAEHCLACHGTTGDGQSEMASQIAAQGATLPDFTDPAFARAHSPAEWYQVITDGRLTSMMPPWSDTLTDSQRWDVAYYLYTLSQTPDTLTQGEMLYDSFLAGNYGIQGENIGLHNNLEAVAALTQQDIYDTFVSSSVSGLSEDQIWAVVDYMQTFGYDPSLSVAAAATPAAEGTPGATQPAESGPTPTLGPDDVIPTGQPIYGTVSGIISNGTAGGTVPDGLDVALSGLTLDMTGSVVTFLEQDTTPDADGYYEFTDLPFDVDQSAYVVEVIYNGVVFADGQLVDPTQPNLEVPITIYEGTTDPSVVTVNALHVIVSEHPDSLVINQLYVFSNSSDKVFVTDGPISGGERGSVSVTLPDGAYNPSFQEGELGGRFIQSGNKIYDTYQMTPGDQTHQLIMTYVVPYKNGDPVSIPIDYQTDQVNLLVDNSMKTRADQLDDNGTTTVDTTTYRQFTGQDFAPGDSVTFTVSNGGVLSRGMLPTLLFSLAGGLILGGIVFWVLQRRHGHPVHETELSSRGEALLEEIAGLDAAFEAGKLSRFDYEARRADLKAALAEEMEGGE